jgi:AcrR family transcriptional regulator
MVRSWSRCLTVNDWTVSYKIMTDHPVTNLRSRRPQARPAEILSAALDLFAEKGFAATRMEDVASRAGLSKAAIYLYFPDKVALLKALVSDVAGSTLVQAAGLIQQHTGPVSPVIRQMIVFMAARLRDTRLPELMKVVISESRAHPEVGQLYLENVIAKGLPLFEGLIRRGIETGEFRAIDPALAVKALVGPMLLAAIWRTVFEPLGAEALDIEAYATQHADVYLKGLAP